MKKWVSEVVTQDEIKSWGSGDIVTISAGTGAGKSRFIKVSLYAHARQHGKKILFLIHRTNCVNQFEMEIVEDKKTDVIEIMTYQTLEAIYRKGGTFDFSQYHFVICDEFHFFMSDSPFNKYTDISLELILAQTDKIRILMSATGNYVKKYISNYKEIKTIDYELPITYEFINELTYFLKDETLDKIIEGVIVRNEKAIFFIQSAKKAFQLYLKYKDQCLFNCSKHNDQYYKFVDEDKINDMLKNESFEERILITTTALDTGVNIVDRDLKQIVCDVKDVGVLKQCIGRKRIQDENDSVHVYIKNINNQQLGGMQTQINKRRGMAQFLREHTVSEYIEKYPRDYDKWNIVYDDVVQGEPDKSTKKINELMFFKCMIDVAEMDTMKSYKDFGYCKYVANLLGFYDKEDGFKYTLIEENHIKDSLEGYLDGLVGKKLFSCEQQELSDLIIKELVVSKKTDYRTKKLKPSTLETIIRDQLDLPFGVSKSKKENKGNMSGKRYIVIAKL